MKIHNCQPLPERQEEGRNQEFIKTKKLGHSLLNTGEFDDNLLAYLMEGSDRSQVLKTSEIKMINFFSLLVEKENLINPLI